MQRTTMDLWVGLFVIAGIGALLILALKVGNLGTYSEAQSYTLIGNFENVGGLKIRAPVKSAGVPAERREGIEGNRGDRGSIRLLKVQTRPAESGDRRLHRHRNGTQAHALPPRSRKEGRGLRQQLPAAVRLQARKQLHRHQCDQGH